MNDLESLLKNLRPAEPRTDLTRRIGSCLEKRSSSAGTAILQDLFRAIATPFTTAAAASLVLLALTFFFSAQEKPDPKPSANTSIGGIEPRSAAEVLVQTTDDGIIGLRDNTPVRQMRYQYLKSVEYRDTRSGATWNVSFPSQETWLVPAYGL